MNRRTSFFVLFCIVAFSFYLLGWRFPSESDPTTNTILAVAYLLLLAVLLLEFKDEFHLRRDRGAKRS